MTYNVKEIHEQTIESIRINEQTARSDKLKKRNYGAKKQWQRAKTIRHYQTEYDRIRNHLNDTSRKGITREQALNRKKTLEDLGAAFDFTHYKLQTKKQPS